MGNNAIKSYLVEMKEGKKKVFYSVLAPGEDYIREQLPAQLGGEILSIEPNYCISSTDVDVYISLDGVDDHFRLASQSAKTIDLRINDIFVTNGGEFYQKIVSAAPTSGAVWVEAIYT